MPYSPKGHEGKAAGLPQQSFPFIESKRPRYHQSELHAFMKCGKLWEFRYLRGLKMPPRAAQTVGISVDSAVSGNLSQKIYTGRDVSTEEVLDAYSSKFDELSAETNWQEEQPGRQKDVGAQLVKLHHEKVAPWIEPATVQESFVVRTDADYDLGGTIDLTEKSGMVVDTKTSRTSYAPNAISKALQPAMYDFAFEALRKEPSKGFRYDVLIKPTSKSPAKLQQVEGKVDRKDREWLFDSISQVHRAIQAGVAMPAPEGSWYCSRTWCGFWNICKGSKR